MVSYLLEDNKERREKLRCRYNLKNRGWGQSIAAMAAILATQAVEAGESRPANTRKTLSQKASWV
jgi:hypothetical protein